MYDPFSERQEAKEREEEEKRITGSLSPWLIDTSFDACGVARPGKYAPTTKHTSFAEDVHFQHGATNTQTIEDWGRTAEGRKALAASRPKPKLEKRGPVWRYTSTKGEIWQDVNRLHLLEKIVFGNQSHEQLTSGMKEFLAKHKDYIPDPVVWAQMVEWLAEEEYFCTVESLELAWKAIKPTVRTKSREIASQIVNELKESDSERQRKEFEKMSDSELQSAMRSVAEARKQGLI